MYNMKRKQTLTCICFLRSSFAHHILYGIVFSRVVWSNSKYTAFPMHGNFSSIRSSCALFINSVIFWIIKIERFHIQLQGNELSQFQWSATKVECISIFIAVSIAHDWILQKFEVRTFLLLLNTFDCKSDSAHRMLSKRSAKRHFFFSLLVFAMHEMVIYGQKLLSNIIFCVYLLK